MTIFKKHAALRHNRRYKMGTAQNEQEKKDNKNAGKSTYQYSGDSKIFQDGRGRTAHRTVVRLVKLIDVIMVTIPFVAAWY